MRIRTAIAATVAGVALLAGGAIAPAQAAESKPAAASSVESPVGIQAQWRTLDEFFWYDDCDLAKEVVKLMQPTWILRCHGGGPLTSWKLQRYY